MKTNKIYKAEFPLDSKILAIIYICYKYKFPLQWMLTFYEMYGDRSLFTFKALTCTRKAPLNDQELIKIMEESRRLFNQIQKGISVINKRKRIEMGTLKEQMPDMPTIDLLGFSVEYGKFIRDYLVENITDIYAPIVELKMSSEDIYSELS